MTSKIFACVVAIEELEELDHMVVEVITSAWASSTLSVRNSQWKRFLRFAHTYGLVPLPAEVSTVARFLVSIGQEVRYSTVNNYTSAIISLHKFYGYETDFRSYYLIKLVLKGLKMIDTEGNKARLPFTVTQLDVLYDRTVNSYHEELCWLAVIICTRTLLRKCNILPSKLDDPHIIKRRDVEILPDILIITIYSSKTRHAGDEPLKIPIKKLINRKFCVYTRLLEHFALTGMLPESPLIMKPSGKGISPLMYSDVLQFLKKGAKNFGMDPSRIGLHSLCRTGAMHLYSIGIPLNDIRLIGDWKSLAFLVYLSAPFQRLVQVEDMSSAAFNNL